MSKGEILVTIDSCRQGGQLLYRSKIILFRLSQEQEENIIFVINSLALCYF